MTKPSASKKPLPWLITPFTDWRPELSVFSSPKSGASLLKLPSARVPVANSTELREVIVLHFQKDFYFNDKEKAEKHGVHFWKGEGNSNQFFQSVSHWMPMPKLNA
jgi:hypothetical protein